MAKSCVLQEIRPLTETEFGKIARLAYDEFGLDLKRGKEELVTARLGKEMRKRRFRTFSEYYQHLLDDATGEALLSMINALTTNHTSFFREPAHFDFLTKVAIPNRALSDPVRIWSAACSSGEEPYSILMALGDVMQPRDFERLELFATDISTRVLESARRGVYPEERFEEVSKDRLCRYLLRGEGRSAGYYRIKPALVRKVRFERVNLVEPLPNTPPVTVIFCRNVMIYFDRSTQESLVNRLSAHLEPGGYLFVGHAESLTGVRHGMQYVKPSIYRKATKG